MPVLIIFKNSSQGIISPISQSGESVLPKVNSACLNKLQLELNCGLLMPVLMSFSLHPYESHRPQFKNDFPSTSLKWCFHLYPMFLISEKHQTLERTGVSVRKLVL